MSHAHPRSVAHLLVPLVTVFCLTPFVPGAAALLMGVVIAVSFGNPYPTKAWIHPLLGLAVAGLGAGMDLETVARVGVQGFGYTVVSIAGVTALGLILTRMFRVEREVGFLITIGTAICGGSAIAAITPVLRAKSQSVSVALGTVFILNAVALVVFPLIGHAVHMPEAAFGLWSALAIHDTSSVVGATVGYGPIASEVGTTVKLARALWIVPITAVLGMIKPKSRTSTTPAKKPWFILWFLVLAAAVTWLPMLQPAGHIVELLAKRLLVVTLLFIGLNLSRETLATVGIRPLVLGVTLWIVTAALTFFAITNNLI